MRWLVHQIASPAVAEALLRHGQKVHQPAELGLAPEAGLSELLAAAGARQWDIVTADPTLARLVCEPGTGFGRTVVFLQLPGGEVEQDDAIDRFFARYPRPAPRRLYTVTQTRVKVRQLPG
jgi:hypothetical protein